MILSGKGSVKDHLSGCGLQFCLFSLFKNFFLVYPIFIFLLEHFCSLVNICFIESECVVLSVGKDVTVGYDLIL